MNARLAVYIAAALLVSSAAAAEERRVRFGAVGGAAWTDLTTPPQDTPFRTDRVIRPDFGLTTDIRLGGPFSLDVRALWTQRGVRVRLFDEGTVEDRAFGDSDLDVSVRLGYVSLPVMLKVTAPGRRLKPYVMAGPELSIRRNAHARLTGGSGDVEDQDLGDSYHSTDWGLRVGAGLEIPAGRTSMFLETSYARGLRSVFNPRDHEQDDPPYPVKTRSFTLNAGIRF